MRPEVRIQGGVAQTQDKKWRPIVTLTLSGEEPQKLVGQAFDTEDEAMSFYQKHMSPTVQRLAKEMQKELDDEST